MVFFRCRQRSKESKLNSHNHKLLAPISIKYDQIVICTCSVILVSIRIVITFTSSTSAIIQATVPISTTLYVQFVGCTIITSLGRFTSTCVEARWRNIKQNDFPRNQKNFFILIQNMFYSLQFRSNSSSFQTNLFKNEQLFEFENFRSKKHQLTILFKEQKQQVIPRCLISQ